MSILRHIDLASVPITKANWQAAKAFYAEKFGLTPTFAADEFGWAQFGFGEGKSEVALSRWDDESPPSRKGATVVFNVADAHQAIAELRARGVTCDEPVGIPGMVTYANIYDLEGNQFQIAGPPPQG